MRPSDPDTEDNRERALPGGRWSWAQQVHGATVIDPGRSGAAADAIVGTAADRPSMFAADCALLGILSAEEVVGAVHAGWKGLLAGVIEETAAAMRMAGATELFAVRGPCIGPECYEFGEADLEPVAKRYGDEVRALTAGGQPALDLVTGVRIACAGAGIEIVHEVASCTACGRDAEGSPLWFSHRARGDTGRHALVVAAAR